MLILLSFFLESGLHIKGGARPSLVEPFVAVELGACFEVVVVFPAVSFVVADVVTDVL